MAGIEFIESDSIILRYSNTLSGDEARLAQRVSIREGAAIVGPVIVDDVELYLLDLSSYAASGTFKDAVACITVMHCLQSNINKFVTQTSGNTGNALAQYTAKAGIHAVVLYPRMSRYKIDSEAARAGGVTFVEVDGPEPFQKLATRQLASLLDLPWLPTLDMQIAGNRFRAFFVSECATREGITFQWHAQALSSAYGFLGFYDGVVGPSLRSPIWDGPPPRPLGIQQEAVSPYVDFWHGDDIGPRGPLLEPTLFRSDPGEDLLRQVVEITRISNGSLERLLNGTFEAHVGRACEILASQGLHPIQVETESGLRFLENAPLIATAGVLDQIEKGLIAQGARVLIAITGGMAAAGRGGFTPSRVLRSGDGSTGVETLAAALRSQLGCRDTRDDQMV